MSCNTLLAHRHALVLALFAVAPGCASNVNP
jgi:hypothetical protein